ncbi:MAG: DUF305 domain-containing protein [Streptosporangiales bacterium]|nr:DUF305 domain-containing protein [Streptosporangiales bacterium]
MTTFRMPVRRTTAAAAAFLAALALAGCGGSSGHEGHDGESSSASTSEARADHNDADVTFARSMIPHHRQAVEMSELAETRSASPKVEKLAAQIERAQAPEIRTMSGWLRSWGQPVPKEGESSSHEGHDMSGMMSDADMKKLRKASGAKFDTMFLEMMIEHHEGAVSMAKTEQKSGSHRPAKKMAGTIITTQRAEIARMNKLLDD